MSTRYEVEYHYYQHNSGMADNGNYTARRSCSTLSEAYAMVRQINDAIKNYEADSEREWTEIEDKLIPYAGHFTRPLPEIFEITERKIE